MWKHTRVTDSMWILVVGLLHLQISACGGDSPKASPVADTKASDSYADTAPQAEDLIQSFEEKSSDSVESDSEENSSDVTQVPDIVARGFGLDYDQDGIDDLTDNCVFEQNPEQDDMDEDGKGDDCDDDIDADTVPNNADLWPKDASLPGTGSSALIYAHTAAALYTLNPTTMETTLIGDFIWPDDISAANPLMADIALDEYGVLYAISFDDLFVCHPVELSCIRLGTTPKRFNGLTMIPKEIMNSDGDILIATTPDGGWHQLTFANDEVSSEKLGNYGETYTSNGDAFSIQGFGTFVTARSEGADYDIVAKVNPLNGSILDSVVDLFGFQSIKGLAGWNSQIFVFDGSGAILQVKLSDSTVKVASDTGPEWRGAGVRTSN